MHEDADTLESIARNIADDWPGDAMALDRIAAHLRRTAHDDALVTAALNMMDGTPHRTRRSGYFVPADQWNAVADALAAVLRAQAITR